MATVLKNAYLNPSLSNTKKLKTYLGSICGKQLAISCIRQNIFRTRWTQRQDFIRRRSNIQAAHLYLDHLIDTYNEYAPNNIKVVVAELAQYVKTVDPKEDLSFILPHVSNTVPPFLHFHFAKSIFQYNKLPDNGNGRYTLDLMILYILRLSLESRILNFLGLDYVLDKKNKPVSFSRLYRIVKSLENVSYIEEVAWDEIQVVNKWLNHFMHRHIRPYPWSIYQAFRVLDPLIEAIQYVEGDREGISFHRSTVVVDKDLLKQEIREQIIANFESHVISWKGFMDVHIEPRSFE